MWRDPPLPACPREVAPRVIVSVSGTEVMLWGLLMLGLALMRTRPPPCCKDTCRWSVASAAMSTPARGFHSSAPASQAQPTSPCPVWAVFRKVLPLGGTWILPSSSKEASCQVSQDLATFLGLIFSNSQSWFSFLTCLKAHRLWGPS